MRSFKPAAAAIAALCTLLPLAALASGGAAAGASNPWLDIVFKFINFAMLLGIIYYALRKSLPQQLRDRKEGIARELQDALAAKDAAESKLADFQQRVANLEAEISKMKEDFKSEGELQKKRLGEEAILAADHIRKNAVAAGDREVKRVTEELKGDAARLALEIAEQILTKAYAAEDQKKALAQTIAKIEGMH
jgi:F-type H+-transporting ATPase subunit b